ncbi:hypothetical protein ONJ45_27990, partial [Salmonella enterica subsp. enterica serovar Virginia]|nr:hypothetical protein [Salmonella enterica subsp. enterica serovar Virginia]
IVDNRQVHHADQHQNARRAPGHFTVVKGVPQGDDPGVEKQQQSIDPAMRSPLRWAIAGFLLLFMTLALMRMRNLILLMEKRR